MIHPGRMQFHDPLMVPALLRHLRSPFRGRSGERITQAAAIQQMEHSRAAGSVFYLLYQETNRRIIKNRTAGQNAASAVFAYMQSVAASMESIRTIPAAILRYIRITAQ